MNGSRPRAGRRFLVGLACVSLSAVACSDDDGDAASTPTPTASADPAESADSPEAQVEAVFHDYWDAVITAQAGQSADPAALFEDLATEETAGYNVDIARQYEQEGLVRVGEPVLSNVSVQVVSASGVVSACVDESEWLAQLSDGTTLPPPEEQLEPHPVVFEVVRSDGSWLIGEPIEAGGTVTC